MSSKDQSNQIVTPPLEKSIKAQVRARYGAIADQYNRIPDTAPIEIFDSRPQNLLVGQNP